MTQTTDLVTITFGETTCHMCAANATKVVVDRELKQVMPVCDEHADDVLAKDFPEYIIHCPNCCCFMGVN